MKAQAVLQQAEPYLDELEARLRQASARHTGVVARVATDALDAAASGSGRCSSISPRTIASVRAGRGRGRARAHGHARARRPGRRRRAQTRARGGLAPARGRRGPRRGRLPLRERVRRARRGGRPRGRADPRGHLPRARSRKALQRSQQHDADTTEEAYFERIALKTGKLFEAACLLGSRDERLGRFGLALGMAFQIVDDILDCSGDTIETGKVAGTDLREGTPTLPLLLAAREDDVVREALAGGPVGDALVRVAATGALERSRDVGSTTRGGRGAAPRRAAARGADAHRDRAQNQRRDWRHSIIVRSVGVLPSRSKPCWRPRSSAS